MSLTAWFKNNQRLAGPLIIVVLLGAAAAIVFRGGKQPHRTVANKAWFYDVGNGELFADDDYKLPPIPGQTAPDSGVRATVFACGSCQNAADRRVTLLTTYTLAVRDLVGTTNEELRLAQQAAIDAGTLVAAPPKAGEKPSWHALSTPEGAALARQSPPTCPGGQATPCASAQ